MSQNRMSTQRLPVLAIDDLRLRFFQLFLVVAAILVGSYNVILIAGGRTLAFAYPLLLVVILASLAYVVVRGAITEIVANVIMVLFLAGLLVINNSISLVGVGALLAIALPLFATRPLYVLGVVVLVLQGVLYDLPLIGTSGFNILTNVLTYIIALVIVSVFLRIFQYRLQAFIAGSERTTELLTASTGVGQVISQEAVLAPMLAQVVTYISEQLGYYHVQIFLSDERVDRLYLAASTGDIGRVLLNTKRSLRIEDDTLPSRAFQTGEPVMGKNLPINDYTFGQSLQLTREELSLPIIEGLRIIGVLDIHSERTGSISAGDVQALQVIASQLASAIRIGRATEEETRLLTLQAQLQAQAQTDQAAIDQLKSQVARRGWQDYLRVRNVISGVTLDADTFHPGADWTAPMQQATDHDHLVQSSTADHHILTVPIRLRGEMLGAIEIEVGADAYTEDLPELLTTIANRLALSLDNARLLEETQEANTQEQRINEIVSGFQAAGSIERLLQLTLEGLTEALGAEQGAIRLGNVNDVLRQPNGVAHHA